MKSPKSALFKSALACCAAAAGLFAGSAAAQTIAYDDASQYQLDANWTNNANQGFGYIPWVIVTNDTGPGPSQFHGVFATAASVIPPYANATFTNVAGVNYTNVWGVFANGTNGVNQTAAFRGFVNPLGTNTFKLQWGAKGAGTTTVEGVTQHGKCGFSLRTGNATSTPDDYQSAARFTLYFEDGNIPSTLWITDGASDHSVPGTSFSDLGRGTITNAVQAEVTPGADGNTYHLVLKDCVAGKVLFTYDGTLAGGGSIDSAALFVRETTGDAVYNRMEISVPRIPPTIVNLAPANGALYVSVTETNFSFEVDSFGSTVATNAVTVLLNGVPQTGVTFNTAVPANQLLASFAPALTSDTVYTMTVIAQNAVGESATNSSTFNTFLPSNIFIDAYDYNYGSGQFVNAATPSNAYSGFLGTNGVDYSIADQTGVNNVAGYRAGDLPAILTLSTDGTGDPYDHGNLRANGFTAFNIGFNDGGNWENYTRVYPAGTNYSIYARAAGVGNGVFEMSKLVSASATTTNQPLAPIGRVNVPLTGGSKVFAGPLLPLTDAFGNAVVLPLAGTNTLRTTSISGQGYNLEYLVAVPAVGSDTLRPYIATANPAPNATGISTLSKIVFNIANRQTTVSSVQLTLNGTNFNGSVLLTNNAAGTIVFFNPTNLPASATNTLVAIITDNTATAQTNTWTFRTTTVAGNGVWAGGAGPSDMTWAAALNWTGGVPGVGNTAAFASVGGTNSLATNNIVAANTTIQTLLYETNNAGFHTTWIQDGITLTVSNGTLSATTAAVQVGGGGNGVDNPFAKKTTNVITGAGGTLFVTGPLQFGSNNLNFQVRQCAVQAAPNQITLDMSGLGTLTANVGKFYVAQGGGGIYQSNVSGCMYLARTNTIRLLRSNSGQFEVGDSSGGAFTLPGSALYWGITNTLFVDTMRIGKQKATNNLVTFNPAFTNQNPIVVMRGTNGVGSRMSIWTIGDAEVDVTGQINSEGTTDFSSGRLDALVKMLVLGQGSTSVSDSGRAQGVLTFGAGTLDADVLTNGVQRAASVATAVGIMNINGTATLVSSNLVLAQVASGGTPSLVSGTLNVTNGTVRANIVAGGGVSTINLVGGKLFPGTYGNTVGSSAFPLTTLNLSSASLHFRANGNSTVTNIVATTVTTSGTTVITIDSVSNVVSTVTNRLLAYTGASPFANLSLAAMPGGYTGSLVDSGGSIDLVVNVSAVPPSPTIGKITYSGGQVILSGTNNAGAGGTFSILSSTNLTTPFASWTVLTNGVFDGSGNFISTNAGNTNAVRFFILKVP